MFGRFFLPTTPFLLLLVEWLVQRLPHPGLRLAGGVIAAGLVVGGAAMKHHWLFGKRHIAGIVDERLFYPDARMREIQAMARPLRDCLAATNATFLVQGGQASLAYYARFPVAIERYGLTDETIAHAPIRRRARPGHEKAAPADYVYKRRVNLRINYSPVRSAPIFTQFFLPGVTGEIIVYDRALMDRVRACPGAQFLDFPRWLAQEYIPRIPQEFEPRLRREWNQFQLFYFMHNEDPEGLRERLRAALVARGITGLPDRPPPEEFQDLGRPSGSP
jgi:hypothetical protein